MFRTKTNFAIIFLALIFLLAGRQAFACSCSEKSSVLDELEGSETVVIAKVVSVEKTREKEGEYDIGHIRSTKMIVRKVYKGDLKAGDETIFGQGGGADCIWTFDEDYVGKEFLFYVGKPSKGHPFFSDEETADKDAPPMYYAVTCGRSNSLAGAGDDLLYLDKMDKVQGKTRISGSLNGWSGDAPSFANLKIKIIGKNKTYETTTNKNGVYEIYDLPPGEYLIEPQTPKGWKINVSALKYSSGYADKSGQKLKSKNQVPVLLNAKSHLSLDLLFEIDNGI